MKQPPSERPDARDLRVALLRARFNASVVDGLASGARAALEELGASPEAMLEVDVPGALELPLAAAAAAGSGRFDAIVALGAVIRGETDHYQHIARETAAGLAAVARETGVPVGFGVLTVANEAQARARSGPGPGNKGGEAARAAVAMVHALRELRSSPSTGTPARPAEVAAGRSGSRGGQRPRDARRARRRSRSRSR